MQRFDFALTTWAILFLSAPGSATAAVLFEQGFEADTAGWTPICSPINSVPSGTSGVPSATGSRHAVVSDSINSAAYTRFDGDRYAWPGAWITELDVYLDTDWNLGAGFNYAVATNGTDNAYQRDFIFHVMKDATTHSLLVGASETNNCNDKSKSSLQQEIENISHYEVAATGWYTLQHVFYESAGVLVVDLKLLDSSGKVLFTQSLSHPGDTIPNEIGGNRYGFFTAVTVGDAGLAIDNSRLEILSTTPEPATLLIWSLLGLAGAVVRYRR
jgi:hypothetical protein